jgi:tetratricopeptide (TPR) repeat protein
MAEEAEDLAAPEERNTLAGSEAADPVAVTLALGGASREQADGFLRDQRRLTALQISRLKAQDAHFHEEAELELAHLRWRRFEDRMKGATRLMLVAVGALLLGAVALAMWEASRADGLVVDAFSVPPTFAASGVAADVLADDLTTRLAAIRDFANDHSMARSRNVNQDRTQEIKVEIPDTGISLTQAWRYLKLWLGHERRLTGNLRDLGDGKVALTVALDGADAFVLQGAAKDLDNLEDQAAEKIFAGVDPINNVLYLSAKGRPADALAAAAHLAQAATTPPEMSDAYALWANETHYQTGDLALAMARARIAIAKDPKTTTSHMELMNLFTALGHDEEAFAQAGEMAGKRKEDEPAWRTSDAVAYVKLEASNLRSTTSGDFQQALLLPCYSRSLCSMLGADLKRAEYPARLHDIKLSRALSADAAAAGTTDPVQEQRTRYFTAVAEQDWPAALASAQGYVHAIQATRYAPRLRNIMAATQAMPLLAYALARTGDMAAAHRAIDGTPIDCYLCLDMRGNIDALQHDWGGAQTWFARAVSASPSSVFAYADWGSMLLSQGKPDAAIAQFKLANRCGPHFADALEGWGEALMAKNQSHLALAKFAEANKYAPNWGRLHLKWGEALSFAGKPDAAKAEFARAAALDLTPSEKSELAKNLQGMNHV